MFTHNFYPATVTALETMRVARQVYLVVALSSGDVRFYKEKVLLHTLRSTDVVKALRFGRFGREDSSLALITRSGGLLVKILMRTANLEPRAGSESGHFDGTASLQLEPLEMPLLSPLAAGQATRERGMAAEMHASFQRDLIKLRLATAQAYVERITLGEVSDSGSRTGSDPTSNDQGPTVNLNVEVLGLGPSFLLKVATQNNGGRALKDVAVAVAYGPSLYRVTPALVGLPILLPGSSHSVSIQVECVDESAPPSSLKLFVVNPQSQVPYASAVVSMPQSEFFLE
jgi:Bardet-Biedl syndrome 1 protein